MNNHVGSGSTVAKGNTVAVEEKVVSSTSPVPGCVHVPESWAGAVGTRPCLGLIPCIVSNGGRSKGESGASTTSGGWSIGDGEFRRVIEAYVRAVGVNDDVECSCACLVLQVDSHVTGNGGEVELTGAGGAKGTRIQSVNKDGVGRPTEDDIAAGRAFTTKVRTTCHSDVRIVGAVDIENTLVD